MTPTSKHLLLLVVSSVVLSALGQNILAPPFHDFANSVWSSSSALLPTTATDPFTYADLTYARVQIPMGAYAMWINASNPGWTSGATTSTLGCYSNFDYRPQLAFWVSKYFPCSNSWAANWYQGSGTAPLVVCNVYDNFLSYNDNFAWPELDAHYGFLNTLDGHPSVTTPTGWYIKEDNVNMYAGGDYWVAVGRTTSSDSAARCSVEFDNTMFTCPDGTLPYTAIDTMNTTVCVPYQNLSINGSGTYYADTVTNTRYYALHLDYVPENTSRIDFNLTVPGTVTSGMFAAGASFMVSAYALDQGTPVYWGNAECSLANTGGAPIGIANPGGTLSYIGHCFAPKWGGEFFVSIDLGQATTLNASVTVHTCTNGLGGPDCMDPFIMIDTTSNQTYTGMTGPTGCAHFYFDVPAWSWDTSVISFSNNVTGRRVYLRPNTFSFTNSNSGYLNQNGYESRGWYTTSVVSGIASTPFERYSSVDTRWVFTFECTYLSSCAYNVSIATWTPPGLPAPVPPSAPVSPTPAPAPVSPAPSAAPTGSPTPVDTPISPPTAPPSGGTPTGSPSGATHVSPRLVILLLVSCLVALFLN